MIKFIGYLMSGLIVLVLLILAAAGVMLATLDPNDYKDQIKQAVYDSTGRTLTLDGDISISYFPVFGFTVSQASLSNPSGFRETNFAAIEELQVGIKIMPLLGRSIELDSIHLVRPVINVIKLPNGNTNLSFENANSTNITTSNSAVTSAADKKNTRQSFSLSTGEIKITDATINYVDQVSGSSYLIAPFNLTMSSFSFEKTSSVDFDAVIKNAETKIFTAGKMDVLVDKSKSYITVSNISNDIDITNPALSKSIVISLKEERVLVDMATKKAQLEGTKIKWDDTNIEIKGSYGWAEKTDAQFDISANTIDLDKILAVVAPETQKKLSEKPAAPSSPPSAVSSGSNETPLSLSALQNLSANGVIKVGTFKVYNMTFTDMNARVRGTNGVLDFDPVSLNLYEGTLSAMAHMDARNGVLKMRKQGKVQNVALGSMLKDYLGKDYVTGRANIDFDVNSTGKTMSGIMNNLGGRIGFQVGEGNINHWQLSQRINQALSFFDSGALDENADEQIKFTTLGGTFIGQSGIFRNDDLTMIGPKIHALGNGAVNVGQKNVNYTVRVGLGDNPETFTTAKHIPVTMNGPFSELRYGVDVQSMIMEQAGEKIEAKKQELIGKALEKLGVKSNAPAETQGTAETPPAEANDNQAINPALKFLGGVLNEQSKGQ